MTTAGQDLPPVKIAFVIDGKVADVLHTDDRLGALFLSNPVIVDVTENYVSKDTSFNIVGWDYDGETFIKPTEEEVAPPAPLV